MGHASPNRSRTDLELARGVTLGDPVAFEALMRRYNARLFRVARAILRDDAEAEDAVQDAYLNAFRHMREFQGEAQLATWLTRIVINEALMRLRRRRRENVVTPFSAADHPGDRATSEVADEAAESPVETALRAELRRLLEKTIDELPVAFRTVFVMREVEDMTVEETARCLGIPPATVRTRQFRARALLRARLSRDLDLAAGGVFGFAGERCDRIVAAVLDRQASGA